VLCVIIAAITYLSASISPKHELHVADISLQLNLMLHTSDSEIEAENAHKISPPHLLRNLCRKTVPSFLFEIEVSITRQKLLIKSEDQCDVSRADLIE